MVRVKVMVVEDEPPILLSICRLLEACGEDIEIVCRAINGKRALEYLEKYPADIIFSDIKMPVMDGMELAREVHQSFPDTQMFLISGFQEFEFARTAIQYGVKDYLLKPVSGERVHDLLRDSIAVIHRRHDDANRRQLRQIVAGEPLEAYNKLETDFFAALYCEGPFPMAAGVEYTTGRELVPAGQVEDFLAAKGRKPYVVQGHAMAERLVLFTAKSAAEAREEAASLYQYLSEKGQHQITLVYADTPIRDLEELAKRYPQLRGQIHRELYLFHSTFMTDAKSLPYEASYDFTQWSRGMLLALKTGGQDELLASTRKLAHILIHHRILQTQVITLLEKLILGSLSDMLSPRQAGNLIIEIQACVSRAQTPESFAHDLAEVLHEWSKTGPVKEQKLAGFCEKAAEILRARYRENIPMHELAELLGCSAAQLSKKFKEYFGISISEYMNEFRIKLACSMLQQNKDLRIKEIAIDAGFSDQYYFSKVFKKNTGKWPTEYIKEL